MKQFFKKNKKSLILIGIILLLSGGVTAYLIGNSAEVEKPEEEKEARLIETDILEYSPYPLQIEGHGFVQSSRSLVLSARTGGQAVYCHEDLKSGTAVSEGDLLIKLDDELTINNLALARVQLIQATASLLSAIKSESSGTIYQRWNSYLTALNTEKDTIPDLPPVQSEREKILTSTYGVLSAYYQVREQEDLLSYHHIRAPFSGHLEGDGIRLYSFVSPGQSLLTLTDTEHLEVSVPLTREELLLLDELESPVTIYPAGMKEHTLPGRIVRKDAVMDRSSQTIMVHIRFDNPERQPLFMPGNYVDISVSGQTVPRAYAISRALINADQTINVYREGKLEFQPVSILARQGDKVILAPTLPEGTEVVITRLQKTFAGMALRKPGETDEAETPETDSEEQD